MLTVIDESTRECLAIAVARRIGSDDVLHRLAGLFSHRGPQTTYDRTTARKNRHGSARLAIQGWREHPLYR